MNKWDEITLRVLAVLAWVTTGQDWDGLSAAEKNRYGYQSIEGGQPA